MIYLKMKDMLFQHAHKPELHACDCDEAPVHIVPHVPKQLRVWLWVPVPHVTEQAPHTDHTDQ